MKCEKTKHAKDKGPQPSFFVNTVLCKSKDKKISNEIKNFMHSMIWKEEKIQILKSMVNV